MRFVQQRSFARSARFETYEDRLALSAQALAHLATVTEAPLFHLGQLESPETETGDFRLEAIEHQARANGVLPALADAHAVSGVDYVQNQFGLDGRGQTIAVIDSGIAYDHLALGGGLGTNYRVVGGWDFAENDADPYDDGPAGFHGTHVAGIIGSDNATHEGVASGVDLVALRVFDDSGAGYFHWVEQALDWVHEHRNDFANPITTVNLSLGTAWNSDSIPSWTTLEDEFAQLKADGIFISVAAGNAFQTYNTAGLSYPAASPHVVPVASVNDAGQFSSFSQRSSRVLAAPGQGIVSTVPDHVFGSDGNPNDFGGASGTSMAAPYVAGASALVREAMQIFGYGQVDQDALYDHLRSTADVFYDSHTNADYLRMNLQSALEALAPSDDFGAADQAHQLGTLSDQTEISGTIERLSDIDGFTFQAAATGTVTVDAVTDYYLAPSWQVGELTGQGASFSFDVQAGEQYTVSLATNEGIGNYDLAFTLEATVADWGVVSFQSVEDQQVSGEAWYEVRASRDAILSVEASFEHSQGNLDLEIYDETRRLLANSQTAGDTERVDVDAEQGERFLIRVRGTNTDVDFRLANLVAVTANHVTVHGTDGTDSVAVDLQEGRLSVNGVSYSFDTVDRWTVNGGAGEDTLTLHLTDGDDRLEFRPNSVVVSAGGHTLTATAESIVAYGGRGRDSAVFFDSNGNDRFASGAVKSTMSGTGFENTAFHCEYVTAYASGGQDIAILHDTNRSDRFESRADVASISNGIDRRMAHGFDRVYAYSLNGGEDQAVFHGSQRADRFHSRGAWSSMNSSHDYRIAHGFDRVYAYGSPEGNDLAFFYGTERADRFVSHGSWSSMNSTEDYRIARGFSRVYAYASTTGEDSAFFHGTDRDDYFVSHFDWSSMNSSQDYRIAHGFRRVYAYATHTEGDDRALFFDSADNDRFVDSLEWSSINSARDYRIAWGFEHVSARAGRGGVDDALFLELQESESIQGASGVLTRRSASRVAEAVNFGAVEAHSTASDSPTVRLSTLDFIFHRVGSWED